VAARSAAECQANQDRRLALRLSEGKRDIENIEAVVVERGDTEDMQFITWAKQVTAFDDGVDDSAGPSLPHASRQKEAYEQLPLRKLECIPLQGNFGLSTQWRNLDLFKLCGVSRDQGDASCCPPPKSRLGLVTMLNPAEIDASEAYLLFYGGL
jgi:hypothetical protein